MLRYSKMFLSAARIILGLVISLSLLFVLLYIFQERLIFFPQPLTEEDADKISKRHPNAEDIAIKSSDGVILRGWLVKNSKLMRPPLIIYFGGNAEEVSYLIDEAGRFNGWSLALMNYRGYGLSQGKPSEKNLFSDAISLYDYMMKRDDIDHKKIIVMGRSLGTGVATYLAQMRRVEGVILVSPFDSLTNIGKKTFPFLPVNLILRHRFDSISRAHSISAPLLVLVAADDKIISARHSEKLAQRWGGEHYLTIIKGQDHNTISNSETYWKRIKDFLARF